ncbi:hypothetical protein OR1_03228 [Geobacter sp. OR-1]|uniref:RNA 2',3'-cyclic phosphodiesterase n=1 Tax=Geobacter sp. OR-1 TaxID=1266765 RepID=UPI000543EBF5|nr:RNA 2',3'-cyclic phosphodiesterase [Geobacter sp. OR-1]GAM10928.1 hypothetical protein OR1_03228 [Geobacter sp. OR-1]
MNRLFVAIDLPEDIRRQILDVRTDSPGFRWVPEHQLHITLRFIGDADQELEQKIIERLAMVYTRHFDLNLRAIGHFPPRGLPRVLWLGIEAPPDMLSLQEAVEKACVSAGVLPEERSFSPHLTIARLKEVPPETVREFEARNTGFHAGPIAITAFHLYASSLTQQGAIHRKVKTFS